MKKVFLSLMTIASLTFTSCSNDDDNVQQATAIAPETTSVAFTVTTASNKTGKLTGKDVTRGSIDVKVKDITVTATKLWIGTGSAPTGFGYSVSELFNLVPDGTAGADTFFKLDKVAIGTNDFKATTTAGGNEVLFLTKDDFEPRSNVDANVQATNYLDKLKGEIPYVVYSGEVLGKYITNPESGTSNNILFNMTTKNGRITSVFSLDETLVKLGYDVTITANCYTNGITTPLSTNTVNIDKGDLAKFQWSNSKAIAGTRVEYVISGQNGMEKFYYVIKGGEIEASTSKSCHYTIQSDTVLVNLNGTDDIIFNWQQWNEVNGTTPPPTTTTPPPTTTTPPVVTPPTTPPTSTDALLLSSADELYNLGYVVGGDNKKDIYGQPDTKELKIPNCSTMTVKTLQHRTYDKSSIYGLNSSGTWVELSKDFTPPLQTASTTWYENERVINVSGYIAIKIVFVQGYPSNFYNGYLRVTKFTK